MRTYDTAEPTLVDESYGFFELRLFQWGYDEQGVYKSGGKPLNFHQCSREELGLEGNNSNFYPTIDRI